MKKIEKKRFWKSFAEYNKIQQTTIIINEMSCTLKVQLVEQLERLLEENKSWLDVDVSQVTFYDSSDLKIDEEVSRTSSEQTSEGYLKGEKVLVKEKYDYVSNEESLYDILVNIYVNKHKEGTAVKFYGIVTNDEKGTFCHVYEHGTMLDTYFKTDDNRSEEVLRKFIGNGLKLLANFHETGLIYTNIKNSSFVMMNDENKTVKLCNFYYVQRQESATKNKYPGTNYWADPTTWADDASYTETIDVYSFGVTIQTLILIVGGKDKYIDYYRSALTTEAKLMLESSWDPETRKTLIEILEECQRKTSAKEIFERYSERLGVKAT